MESEKSLKKIEERFSRQLKSENQAMFAGRHLIDGI